MAAASHIVESIRNILPDKVARVVAEAKEAEKEARALSLRAIEKLNRASSTDESANKRTNEGLAYACS